MFEIQRIDDEGLEATRSYTELAALFGVACIAALGGGWLTTIITKNFWLMGLGGVVFVGLCVAAALHGMEKVRYHFDHEKGLLRVEEGKKAAQEFPYSELSIRRELAVGNFIVTFPGLFKNAALVIPIDRLHDFEGFLAAFEIRRSEMADAKDAQRFLEEKASGAHALKMPEGATSKAGTPVAVPASLSFTRKK